MQTLIRIAAAIGILLSCLTVGAEAAVFRFDPSVLLSEEYNDNIFLQRSHERTKVFITRFAPSVHIKYTTSFWDWDLLYTYNYYHYANGNIPDDFTHELLLRNRTEILKDHFFLEVFDEYRRVSQDVAVDFTQQSPTANQVDQNIFSVNPYFVLRPSLTSRIILGYIFLDRRYLNTSQVSQAENIDHTQNIGYGETAIDLSSRLTFTVGARYTRDQNRVANYNQVDVYAGPQYTYAERSYLYARGGKTWFEFEPKPEDQQHPRKDYWFWDSGINHRINTVTLGLNTRRYIVQDPIRLLTLEDRYAASITNITPRSTITLAGWISEYRDAMIDQRISTTQLVQSSLLYRLTPTTNGTLSATYQDWDEKLPVNGVTKIIIAIFRLDHQLSEKATLSFEYRNVNSHSYDIATNNYFNNRYILEFRQIF